MTSGIKVGMFGPGYADLENQNYIEGNLIQIVDKVVDLLEQMYLIHPIHYKGMQRVEPLEFPIEALREILYNAVAHKDYRGTEITVRVFKDRLEIWNPGTIPSELDINHLWERHGSIQRNRLIAEAFYYAGFVEAWGRGFEKIRDAFTAENLKLPTFATHSGGFEVSILRERYVVISGYDKVMEHMNNVTNENGVDGTINVTKELTERQREILQFLLINAKNGVNDGTNRGVNNSLDISEKMKISTRTLTREMQILKEKGFVRWIGTRRSGHWEIVEKDNE